jgi:hypothetical protein
MKNGGRMTNAGAPINDATVNQAAPPALERWSCAAQVPRSLSAGHAWRVRSAALTMLTQAATEGKRSAHGLRRTLRRPHTRTRCYCAGNQPSDMGRRSAHPRRPSPLAARAGRAHAAEPAIPGQVNLRATQQSSAQPSAQQAGRRRRQRCGRGGAGAPQAGAFAQRA